MEQVTIIKISIEELKKLITESIEEALIKVVNNRADFIGNSVETQSVNLSTICRLYGWKKPTVYGWVHNNLIPNSKVGKFLYINIAEIEKWIAEGRRKTISEIVAEAGSHLFRHNVRR